MVPDSWTLQPWEHPSNSHGRPVQRQRSSYLIGFELSDQGQTDSHEGGPVLYLGMQFLVQLWDILYSLQNCLCSDVFCSKLSMDNFAAVCLLQNLSLDLCHGQNLKCMIRARMCVCVCVFRAKGLSPSLCQGLDQCLQICANSAKTSERFCSFGVRPKVPLSGVHFVF